MKIEHCTEDHDHERNPQDCCWIVRQDGNDYDRGRWRDEQNWIIEDEERRRRGDEEAEHYPPPQGDEQHPAVPDIEPDPERR